MSTLNIWPIKTITTRQALKSHINYRMREILE